MYQHRLRLVMWAGLLVLSLGSVASVWGGLGHRPCCPECGHDKICCPTPEVKKEQKHCYEVECKDVCIPCFKGPCAPCCEPPRCGRVRTVKVLKKVEYECERCGYVWNIKCVDCCR